MNYLVLDLEMCKVPRNYRRKEYQYATEIIQIGAVLLDETFEQIDTFREYVHPEYGVLDYFITHLTGIEGRQVKNAPRLNEALEHLFAWIGEREYLLYAWSDADYLQFRHETAEKHLNGSFFEMTFKNSESFPRVFVQKSHAGVESRPAPRFERIISYLVELIEYGKHLVESHSRCRLRLMSVP